jgi:hypothetical protein
MILSMSMLLAGSVIAPAFAALPSDPYADAVDPTSSGTFLNPDNALGAPDGTPATVLSVLGSALVLDMGLGEEGTGDLTVYYSGLTTGINTSVDFLRTDLSVISTGALNLLVLGTGVQTATVSYSGAPTSYRYVRMKSTLLGAYSVDAIMASSYTFDSDGDGLPDAWEISYGFDPHNVSGANGASGDPDHDGLTNAQEYAAGTSPTNADNDGDDLPDGWEVQHGLDPISAVGANGASGDPDHDGLTNAQEYAAHSNPHNADSDGDGLPDGWEVQYGLSPLSAVGDDGATGDPDHDGRTNEQELVDGTNPMIANAQMFWLYLPLMI